MTKRDADHNWWSPHYGVIRLTDYLNKNGHNADYFNIFTKEALFDYDISKQIYQYCLNHNDLDSCYGINEKRKIVMTVERRMSSIGCPSLAKERNL